MYGNDKVKNALESLKYSTKWISKNIDGNKSQENSDERGPDSDDVKFQEEYSAPNESLLPFVLFIDQEPSVVKNVDDTSSQKLPLDTGTSFKESEVIYQMKDIDKVKIYEQDSDGDTLLHASIILQKTEECKMFIILAPTYRWLSLQNLMFQAPIHLAALTDQPEISRKLVVAGADVTLQDKDGNTALHIASRDGRLNVLKSLLEPVRYDEKKQNKSVVPNQSIPQDFRIANYNGLTCLHLATIHGHIEVLDLLLKNDIDLNMKERKTGRTILHNACQKGDIKLVKFLLRHRTCDINARAFDGNTPFDLARSKSHNNVCMTLAAAGARYGEDPDMTDY